MNRELGLPQHDFATRFPLPSPKLGHHNASKPTSCAAVFSRLGSVSRSAPPSDRSFTKLSERTNLIRFS